MFRRLLRTTPQPCGRPRALPTTLPRLLVSGGVASAAVLTLALGSFTPALSQSSAPPERLTPAQKQKIFPERKALTLRQQKEREAIQQTSRRCVAAASSQAELRTCMKQERNANRELRSKYREEMRKIYERNGIKAPVGGPGKGKGKGKGAA